MPEQAMPAGRRPLEEMSVTEQAEPIGFTMISRDLTDSERIERELRESQECNRGLIESNIDALMTTDPLGIITDVNRQMCEMIGVRREELTGTPFKRYFTDPRPRRTASARCSPRIASPTTS